VQPCGHFHAGEKAFLAWATNQARAESHNFTVVSRAKHNDQKLILPAKSRNPPIHKQLSILHWLHSHYKPRWGSAAMSDNSQSTQYLALAEEAEHHAATGVDRYAREKWLRIAKSYRDIAQGTDADDPRATAANSVPEEKSCAPAAPPSPHSAPRPDRSHGAWRWIKALVRRSAV
jgi:hypothetical protein